MQTCKCDEHKCDQEVLHDFFLKNVICHHLAFNLLLIGPRILNQNLPVWCVHLSRRQIKALNVMNECGQLNNQLQRQWLLPHSSSLLQIYLSIVLEQFPDSAFAKNITTGPIMMSYLLSSGSGTYFNQITVREVIEGLFYFTPNFDETVTL